MPDPGPDLIITSTLGAGVQTIRPTSPLPAITDKAEINGLIGSSCDSWPPQPGVKLDGSLAGPNAIGLTVQANETIIRGLTIYGFTSHGVAIFASNVGVTCNIIGLDAQGNAAGNGNLGVLVNGSNNIVGHYVPTVGNVISANSYGVFIQAATQGNIVRDNRIGTDVNGLLDRGNRNDGILVGFGATGNIIGGVNDFDRNIIAGNDGNGVQIYQNGAAVANQVLGNYIGLTAAGDAPLPNGGAGVTLWDANNNTVGGSDPGQSNRIAFNGAQGVNIFGSSGSNRILGNRVFSNGALGIDLNSDDVTSNDAGDVDTGPNNLQNYPVLSEAYAAGDDAVVVRGSLNSTPNSCLSHRDLCQPCL